MGLSLEFYAGDADKIGSAFTEIEFDGLRNGTIAHSYADLSLHLSPTDLDILSEQVGAILGQPPIPLLDSLERSVGGTPDESEASVVSRAWVAAIAAVPFEQVPQITRSWLQAVAEESGDTVVTESPDAVAAVASLVKLCREAIARDTQVVFVWYL